MYHSLTFDVTFYAKLILIIYITTNAIATEGVSVDTDCFTNLHM